MARKYGNAIGYVMLTSKITQWRGEVSVLYKDETMMIVRDWPNTPLPKYFLIAKNINQEAWKKGFEFMATLDTGGIQLSILPFQVNSDFDTIVSTFITLEQAKAMNEALKA